jgi:hypothetical protein
MCAEVPGAQFALTAAFAETIVGIPKPHMRMIIVAGGEAATRSMRFSTSGFDILLVVNGGGGLAARLMHTDE